MGSVQLYQWLADAVLTAHVLLVVFVVGGLLAVLVGNRLGWGWVNHIAFRLGHLATIAVVVMESWFGITCPLTGLEAGNPPHEILDYTTGRVVFRGR